MSEQSKCQQNLGKLLPPLGKRSNLHISIKDAEQVEKVVTSDFHSDEMKTSQESSSSTLSSVNRLVPATSHNFKKKSKCSSKSYAQNSVDSSSKSKCSKSRKTKLNDVAVVSFSDEKNETKNTINGAVTDNGCQSVVTSDRESVKKMLVLHLPPHGSSRSKHSHEGIRHKRDKFSRGLCHNMTSIGKLRISSEKQVEFTADDLTDLGEIGRGGFGTVNKMVHRGSNTVMAVKGDCWICMELMDTSLDKFYKFIYEHLNERIPENIIGKITVATLKALNYLKERLKIIHRDVKPSNILLDKKGNIKLCDFGISGQLVDSIAKTRDAGCQPYMAPERIDPSPAKGYDVRSDVWSLGITLMELATGCFPYPKWKSVFEQLTQVVQGDPPRLSCNENGNIFTEDFVNFVNTCLTKEESARPKYKTLLDHNFILKSELDSVCVAEYVCHILKDMANNGHTMFTYDSYNY